MTAPLRLAHLSDATPLEILDACLANLAGAQAHGAFVVIDRAGARRAAKQLPPAPALRSTASPSPSRT